MFRYNTRFIVKMIATPLVMYSCIVPAVPVWNWLRAKVIPQMIVDRLKLPPKIAKVNFKRSLINVYLFIFAPLTRDAVQTLVCFSPCSDESDDTCKSVLAFDMSVRCFEGAHVLTTFVAVSVLVVFVVLIPGVLIHQVMVARRKRSKLLNLQSSGAKELFDEIDNDSTGVIDREETTKLLDSLGESMNPVSLAAVFKEIDEDHDNEITFEEFDVWYPSPPNIFPYRSRMLTCTRKLTRQFR